MKNIHRINGNIYITNDEEIKEGDYCINLAHNIIVKPTDAEWANSNQKNLKKVILTDQYIDGIQTVDNDTLEFLIKNQSCEWVEVVKGFADGTGYGYNFVDYKIIIPKQEPKQETLEQFMATLPYYGHCNHEYLEGVEEGAKWQAERMYSEEEVKLIISEALQSALVTVDLEQWFEQFKKK